VLGQVKAPGYYSLKKEMSVVDAIALAGGLTELASGNATKVIRMEDGRKQIITVPLEAILQGKEKSRDIFLEPGDTIFVPESFF
jgi:polysaccharide export outer membrane protein